MPLSRIRLAVIAVIALATPATAQTDTPEPPSDGVATQAIGPATALAPRVISYQGVLEDGGAPVTTATSVTFSLFEADSGGSAVWSEAQSVTPDAEGLFAVQLGSGTALPVISAPLWLEVTVGGTALGPRTALGAAPYALAMHGIRVEPATFADAAPSIAAGHPSNEAGLGAVVAGGGYVSGGLALPNRATGSYSSIGGGQKNTASAFYATVGGGSGNTASGNAATVPGGRRSHARG